MPRRATKITKTTDAEPLLDARQRDLVALGICPFCEEPVRAYSAPSAEGRIDRLLTAGIDPMTGHDMRCEMPQVRL